VVVVVVVVVGVRLNSDLSRDGENGVVPSTKMMTTMSLPKCRFLSS
jgi:hypothetical protein